MQYTDSSKSLSIKCTIKYLQYFQVQQKQTLEIYKVCVRKYRSLVAVSLKAGDAGRCCSVSIVTTIPGSESSRAQHSRVENKTQKLQQSTRERERDSRASQLGSAIVSGSNASRDRGVRTENIKCCPTEACWL